MGGGVTLLRGQTRQSATVSCTLLKEKENHMSSAGISIFLILNYRMDVFVRVKSGAFPDMTDHSFTSTFAQIWKFPPSMHFINFQPGKVNDRIFYCSKERQFCRLLSSQVPSETLPNIRVAFSLPEEQRGCPLSSGISASVPCLPSVVSMCPMPLRYPLWIKRKGSDLGYRDRNSRITNF